MTATRTPSHLAGDSTRRAILLELRRRELAGEAPPRLAELAAAAGVGTSTAHRQTRALVDAGLVAARFYMRRGLRLTAAGRLAADAAAAD